MTARKKVIQQITAAPPGYALVYGWKDEDDGSIRVWTQPITLFALVEDQRDGFQYIDPMYMSEEDGHTSSIDSIGNPVIGVANPIYPFSPEAPDWQRRAAVTDARATDVLSTPVARFWRKLPGCARQRPPGSQDAKKASRVQADASFRGSYG